MKKFVLSAALALAAMPVAAEGDSAAGESAFNRCKSCHGINNGDETIVRGGRTGPDLFGVIGRQAGSVEGFRYGDAMVAAGEAGLIWTEELLVEFIKDPRAFLVAYTGDDSARSNMSFRMPNGGEDIAAYLATFAASAE